MVALHVGIREPADLQVKGAVDHQAGAGYSRHLPVNASRR